MTDDLGGVLVAPEDGLPVLMSASELAAVVQPGQHRNQLPARLVAAVVQVPLLRHTLCAPELLAASYESEWLLT